MEINLGQLSRRDLFIATGSILLTAANGCLPKQPSWSEKLRQQGEKVNADLAKVGIHDKEWHPLISFNTLTPTERQELDIDSSTSQYVLVKNNRNCAKSIVFLLDTDLDANSKRMRVALPIEIPVYIINVKNAGAEWMPEFDLSQLIRYRTSPNGVGIFDIIKYNNAASYLAIPGALTSVTFRGPQADFNSLADVIVTSASSQK